MCDEEEKSPGWGSAALNKLITKMDRKYLRKKTTQSQLRKGLMGPCLIEQPQLMLPDGMLCQQVTAP